MTIQQNTRGIQTTHIGSLPRPHALLDVMKRKYAGETIDTAAFEKTLRQFVVDCVAKQVACGIDIVTDGEFSKPGFFTYVQERLEGFEARPAKKMIVFRKEIAAFPEYYAEYFKTAMMGGAILPLAPVVCIAPVKYRRGRSGQARHRQCQSRRESCRRPGPSGLSSGHLSFRRRRERILQI